MQKVFSEVYRGHVIEVFPDECVEQPNEWDDTVFLVGFHRSFWVKREGYDEETVRDALRTQKHPLRKVYHIFPLAAYIHSGVSLSLDRDSYPFNDQWDTCWVGAVFIAKEEAKRKEAERIAEDTIQTWNEYLSGEVYGYQTDTDDSCWGFYGDIHQAGGLLNHAREAIDAHIETEARKHAKKVKAWILNRVPLTKRVPLPA